MRPSAHMPGAVLQVRTAGIRDIEHALVGREGETVRARRWSRNRTVLPTCSMPSTIWPRAAIRADRSAFEADGTGGVVVRNVDRSATVSLAHLQSLSGLQLRYDNDSSRCALCNHRRASLGVKVRRSACSSRIALWEPFILYMSVFNTDSKRGVKIIDSCI